MFDGDYYQTEALDADGLHDEPEDDGMYHMSGSFICESEDEFELDESFTPEDFEPVFTLLDEEDQEIDHSYLCFCLSVEIDGKIKHFDEVFEPAKNKA